MIATFSSRYVGQDSQEKADPHLFLGTPKAQMNSCNTSWDRIHLATFYTGRDTSCVEKEVLVNVKMIIAKDKIHVNAVWSLQRLYLPFAQLFDRMLSQKKIKILHLMFLPIFLQHQCTVYSGWIFLFKTFFCHVD